MLFVNETNKLVGKLEYFSHQPDKWLKFVIATSSTTRVVADLATAYFVFFTDIKDTRVGTRSNLIMTRLSVTAFFMCMYTKDAISEHNYKIVNMWLHSCISMLFLGFLSENRTLVALSLVYPFAVCPRVELK